MSKETDKLSTFVEEHTGSVKLDGFFYCESLTDYRCTVVAKVETRKARLIEGAEFSGRTAAELVAAAADAGVDLGEPAHVAQLCESAPRSPKPRRRRAAA